MMSGNGSPLGAAGSGSRPIEAIEVPSLANIVAGKHESPDWLIEGIIPQGCFLIVGRAKVGKSWMNLQLGITLAVGGKFLGHEALDCFQVLYIAAEDDPGRMGSRFARYQLEKAPENLKIICRDELNKLAAEYSEHYPLGQFIEAYLLANPGIKAVIIDTETVVRTVWGERERNDLSLVRREYMEVHEFDEIAHRRRVFIGLVNHGAKRRNNRWIDIHELINRPATVLAGVSGSIVLADEPGKDQVDYKPDDCKVLGIRGRDIINDHLLAVQMDAFGLFQSLGTYRVHLQSEGETELLEALEEIGSQSTEPRWITSKELAEWTERRKGAVQRAMSRMLSKADRQTWKKYRIEARPKLGYRLTPL